jgi:hypothetical protein
MSAPYINTNTQAPAGPVDNALATQPNSVVDALNKFAYTDIIAIPVFMFLAASIANTLAPLPESFQRLFQHSLIVKFIILFLFGIIIAKPLNNTKVLIVIVGALVILALMGLWRKSSPPEGYYEPGEVADCY